MDDTAGRKPLIGVTTYLDTARWGVWEARAALLSESYPRLLREAGGLAVMLPPDEPEAAAPMVARMDAVVVSGGPDVEPARYGAERHPRTGPPAPERDAWELAVLDAALASGTPLLAICRGMQLLNVLRGGTLEQHLPERVGHEGHAVRPGVFAGHLVVPVAGTRLAGLLPEPVSVPTHHHQAVDQLGAGLVVSARAEDGTVEALELPGVAFAVGVQWHPEEGGGELRVVRALVAAAEESARQSGGRLL